MTTEDFEYKLVEVHWVDAGHKQGWLNATEVTAYLSDDEDFNAVTVGYEIADTDEFLALVQGFSGKLVMNVVRIPKGMIRKTLYPQVGSILNG